MATKSWTRAGVIATTLLVCGALPSTSLATGAPGGITPDIPTGAAVPQVGRALGPRNVIWQSGPVMHSNRTHVVFWNPSNCSFNSHACSFDPTYEQLITGFLANVSADSHKSTNVFALAGQYFDDFGPAAYDSTFAGAIDDTDPAPPNGCTLPTAAPPGWGTCLSDTQIRTELRDVIISHQLPAGPTDIYFVVTPEGFGSCFGAGPTSCSLGGSVARGYCGYHDVLSSNTSSPGIYANIPFNAESGHCQSSNPRPNASTADPTLSTVSHEQSEAITDPFPGSGWIDPSSGEEVGDLCASSFAPSLGTTGAGVYNQAIGAGRYLLQEEWSNEDGGCEQRDEADTASFPAPASGIVGVPVTLTGSGNDPDGSVHVFVWSFGDGSAVAPGQQVSHTFARPGRFTVTLGIQDVTGQRAFVAHVITIASASITKITAIPGRFKGELDVSTNGPGIVSVAGSQDRRSKAGTSTFTITLHGKARKKIARRGTQSVTRTFNVTFSPLGGATQTRSISMTFRG